MNDLLNLILDEKQLIESAPLSELTKVGQVYCYLTSGPIPMIKIGKGKNGRQRMASWINEYPPSWREGNIIFILDKLNQSTSETSLHRLFSEQRVPPEEMRIHLGLESWQRLPDGASEWFYCDTFVKNSFRSVGIDLVDIYRNQTDSEPPRSTGSPIIRSFRELLGFTTFVITVIMAIGAWGSWALFGFIILAGLILSGAIFPHQ